MASGNNNNNKVPNSLLLTFFDDCTKELLSLDCPKECRPWEQSDDAVDDDDNNDRDENSKTKPKVYPSLSDCKRLLLDKQRSCLHRAVYQYQTITTTGSTNHDETTNGKASLSQESQQQQQLTDQDVLKRLATLKQDTSCPLEIQRAMAQMEEAARIALCQMVIYCQCHLHHSSSSNNNTTPASKTPKNSTDTATLISSGKLERSKLLEYIGLCQTAMKLRSVQEYLANQAPLVKDLADPSTAAASTDTAESSSSSSSSNVDGPTKKNTNSDSSNSPKEDDTMDRFPQTRLEKLQKWLSKAVGVDPEFMKTELKRIFVLKYQQQQQQQQHSQQELPASNDSISWITTADEYSDDAQVLELFRQLTTQMKVIVTNATLQAQKELLLSDQNQGGVTRVVSVSYSEFEQSVSSNNNDENTNTNGQDGDYKNPSLSSSSVTNSSTPPTGQVMSHVKQQQELETKQQLKLASQACHLQQQLVDELLSLSLQERTERLEQAKQVHDRVMTTLETFPPGPERVQYLLTQVDGPTSKLLTIHKLWMAMQQQQEEETS